MTIAPPVTPTPCHAAWHRFSFIARLARCLLGLLCLGALLLSWGAQAHTIQTIAGSGLGPEGAPATSIALNTPRATAIDSAGNLYIADTSNHRIRKVDAVSGAITTVAGTGRSAFSGDNGPASSAQLAYPTGVALDSAGNLYIADRDNYRIRKVDAVSGIITTVAGNGWGGFGGDNGPATDARLNAPTGMALDSAGNLYIADTGNQRIRKVDTNGTITTVAGNGTRGFSGDNGPASNAQLNNPYGVALDSAGNLYIADRNNHRIRKVDAVSGAITTVAGNGTWGFSGNNGPASNAQLNNPIGVALDSAGNLYIADMNNHRIRKVDTNGTITTVAGYGTPGFSGDNGPASSAQLHYPEGVALDSTGNLYIADRNNHRIRKVDAVRGIITTVAGNGTQGFSGDTGPASNAQLSYPTGVALDSAGNLYIADTRNHRIRKVDAVSGAITTVAGTGRSAFSGDNGPASSAQLAYPTGVALDSAGNLYIADRDNYRIRKVDAVSGIITTVAGNGWGGFGGDNGPASSAQLASPQGVALDSTGNLYIADSSNQRIRKVDAVSGIITTAAGNGTWGFGGDNGPATDARLNNPYGVALDSAGNLYIADTYNHRIRKVAPDGTITTAAGDGTLGFSGDNGPASSAQLSTPRSVALDSAGNLYIADTNNQRIRKVAPDGTITTVAGNGRMGFGGDSGPASSAQLAYPQGVALDSTGNLYIADTNNQRIRKVVPGAPGAPGTLSAVAGDGAATLSWTAPSDDGGSPITGYTVTASPGGTCTATPPSTTCTISGLTNDTAYTFAVLATNAVGSSAPSTPASATPTAPVAKTLPLPGGAGAGNASVLISGGPPGCAVAAGDIAFSNNVPAGHPGAATPLGALEFTAKGCPGATLNVSITYPSGSLNGLVPHKYGPASAGAAPSWFAHGTINGDTVTYTVTDDGLGDNEITTPGEITDPFAPLLLTAPPPVTAQPIPTLSEWAMLLMAGLLGVLGAGLLRRQGALQG